MDVAALDGDAGLAGVHHGAPDGGAGGGVQIGVVQDDHGIFAAEFEDDGKQAIGGGDGDPASGGDAAGKDQLVDGTGDQMLAGGTEAGDDLKGTRQPGEFFGIQRGGNQALKFEGGLGREFAGLEDDGVAGGEGGKGIGGGNGERVVPRRDDADDAERLQESCPRLKRRAGLEWGIAGYASTAAAFSAQNSAASAATRTSLRSASCNGLPDSRGNDLGKRLLLRAEHLRQAAEDGGAAHERQLATTRAAPGGPGQRRR